MLYFWSVASLTHFSVLDEESKAFLHPLAQMISQIF